MKKDALNLLILMLVILILSSITFFEARSKQSSSPAADCQGQANCGEVNSPPAGVQESLP